MKSNKTVSSCNFLLKKEPKKTINFKKILFAFYRNEIDPKMKFEIEIITKMHFFSVRTGCSCFNKNNLLKIY